MRFVLLREGPTAALPSQAKAPTPRSRAVSSSALSSPLLSSSLFISTLTATCSQTRTLALGEEG